VNITTITFTLSIVFAIIAGIVGTLLVYRFFDRLFGRLSDLEREIRGLHQKEEQRKQALLDAAKRGREHHSYNTLAALEDAMALLIEEKIDDKIRQDRLETALAILQMVRKNPKAYDPDWRSSNAVD
jgi:hypothetical protein